MIFFFIIGLFLRCNRRTIHHKNTSIKTKNSWLTRNCCSLHFIHAPIHHLDHNYPQIMQYCLELVKVLNVICVTLALITLCIDDTARVI